MKCLLPQKGVEVIEIPKLKDEEDETIIASHARDDAPIVMGGTGE